MEIARTAGGGERDAHVRGFHRDGFAVIQKLIETRFTDLKD